jgi:hypothetical protein
MLNWSIKMAKCAYNAVKERLEYSTHVNLIPVNEKRYSDPDRISELELLVARIVMCSNKRGRPSKQSEEDFPHAA